jgi:hypothetical protein
MRDQVPEQMCAACEVSIGTAATAEAVSCEPTATRSMGRAAPISPATAEVSCPMVSPGLTSCGKSPRGKPSLSTSAVFQSPPTTLSRPVVDALVRSARLVPVSQ